MMGQNLEFEGGYTAESWEYARAFAYSLGNLPSSFTSVIRLLMTDHDKNPDDLTDFGRFFAGRLIKTPSIRAPYFFAIKFFKPELLKDRASQFELDDFLRAFSGYEHAALLAAIFLHRHSKKLSDEGIMAHISPRLQYSLNLGWLVGNAIPAIGRGAGLLMGGFRLIGFIPFSKHDPENFKDYLKHLNERKLDVDLDYEVSIWKCNSLQVALMMCQQLGFGISRVIPLMQAMTTTSRLMTNDEFQQTFRALAVWMESVALLRSAPSIPMPPKYYPTKMALDDLLERSALLRSTSEANWLTKHRESLTPECAPQLFLAAETPAPRGDIPVEMEEALPDETINMLSSKLLRDFLTEDGDA